MQYEVDNTSYYVLWQKNVLHKSNQAYKLISNLQKLEILAKQNLPQETGMEKKT